MIVASLYGAIAKLITVQIESVQFELIKPIVSQVLNLRTRLMNYNLFIISNLASFEINYMSGNVK